MGLPVSKIPVIEEFTNIQGEGKNLGVPYYFIRVGGCPLRCSFCDTERSWKVDKETIKNVEDVVSRAITACHTMGVKWVSITGGEPLIYPKQVLKMIEMFSRARIKTHIETSGRFYDEHVHRACDLYSVDAKTPCTGETMEGYFLGRDHMRGCDQVKCLIHDEKDIHYAYRVNQYLDGFCDMVLQPFNTGIVTSKPLPGMPTPAENLSLSDLRNAMLDSYYNLLQDFGLSSLSMKWKRVLLTPQVHVLTFGNTPKT